MNIFLFKVIRFLEILLVRINCLNSIRSLIITENTKVNIIYII